jgi:hypothetical protein
MMKQLSPNRFADRFASSFRDQIAVVLGTTPDKVDPRLVSVTLAQAALETDWVKSLWNWNFGGLRTDSENPDQVHAYLPNVFENFNPKNHDMGIRAMRGPCAPCAEGVAGKRSALLPDGDLRVWFNRGSNESQFAAYPNEEAGLAAFFSNNQKQHAIRLLASRLPELDKSGLVGHALVREMARIYDQDGLQNTPGSGDYHTASTERYQFALRVRYDSPHLGVHRFVERALAAPKPTQATSTGATP